ncbi:hypothetical protein BGZ50_000194, partial [Haplosporangium sp. Z 11]
APYMNFSVSTLQQQQQSHSLETISQRQQELFEQPYSHIQQQQQQQQQSSSSLQSRTLGPVYPSTPSTELLSIAEPLQVTSQDQDQHPRNLSASIAAESELLQQQRQPHLPQDLPLDSPILWQAQPSAAPQSYNLNNNPSVMDSTSWAGNSASSHQTVGPIPMGFDWPRDQGLNPSDSSARSMGLQGTFHAANASQNSNGNGNGSMHNQSSASPLTGTPGPTMQHGNLANDPNLNHNGVSGGMGGAPTHHNGDPLNSTLPAGALQQQGDLQLRTSPTSPSRDESHHHPHPHHSQQQQQLHVHHTHSSYHHGQLSGHELSPHDQQQQQFQPQHSAYASSHYYGEPDQHESYDHDRVHSGGLVGHPYGNSHDNIAALTPPPSAPVPQHDLPPLRTRLTNTIWEDEHTFCFQVDVKGVCVARRA